MITQKGKAKPLAIPVNTAKNKRGGVSGWRHYCGSGSRRSCIAVYALANGDDAGDKRE